MHDILHILEHVPFKFIFIRFFAFSRRLPKIGLSLTVTHLFCWGKILPQSQRWSVSSVLGSRHWLALAYATPEAGRLCINSFVFVKEGLGGGFNYLISHRPLNLMFFHTTLTTFEKIAVTARKKVISSLLVAVVSACAGLWLMAFASFVGLGTFFGNGHTWGILGVIDIIWITWGCWWSSTITAPQKMNASPLNRERNQKALGEMIQFD